MPPAPSGLPANGLPGPPARARSGPGADWEGPPGRAGASGLRRPRRAHPRGRPARARVVQWRRGRLGPRGLANELRSDRGPGRHTVGGQRLPVCSAACASGLHALHPGHPAPRRGGPRGGGARARPALGAQPREFRDPADPGLVRLSGAATVASRARRLRAGRGGGGPALAAGDHRGDRFRPGAGTRFAGERRPGSSPAGVAPRGAGAGPGPGNRARRRRRRRTGGHRLGGFRPGPRSQCSTTSGTPWARRGCSRWRLRRWPGARRCPGPSTFRAGGPPTAACGPRDWSARWRRWWCAARSGGPAPWVSRGRAVRPPGRHPAGTNRRRRRRCAIGCCGGWSSSSARRPARPPELLMICLEAPLLPPAEAFVGGRLSRAACWR